MDSRCGRHSEVLLAAFLLLLLLWVLCIMSFVTSVAEAQVLQLKHGFAELQGSSLRQDGKGMTAEHFGRLRSHDEMRRRRMLLAVVGFPLAGDGDPTSVGLYYTQVGLGTPVQLYYVQVDTGSDIMWVDCAPCYNCPLKTTLPIPLTVYDPSRSSTAHVVPCSSQNCALATEMFSSTNCHEGVTECLYQSIYGDGSTIEGYFVEDLFTYDQLVGNTSTPRNGSASVVFGCNFNQSGVLSSTPRAVDGLIGFGQASISVLSQLASHGIAPNVFAHCLEGEDKGGGILVIGEIDEPDLIYTPIIQRQQHYNVQLLNIAVNGMNITSPSVFTLSDKSGGTGGGVIFDSGTTLAYLVDPAYTNFVTAITQVVPTPAQEVPDGEGGHQICFVDTGYDVNTTFPDVTLYFEGGAMQLTPQNYLFQQEITSTSGQTIAADCLGWLESVSQPGYISYTIFGDIVLKDKLVVYDNEQHQIGWKNYDCRNSIKVSTTRNGSSPFTVNPTGLSPIGSFGQVNNPRRSLCTIMALVTTLMLCWNLATIM